MFKSKTNSFFLQVNSELGHHHWMPSNKEILDYSMIQTLYFLRLIRTSVISKRTIHLHGASHVSNWILNSKYSMIITTHFCRMLGVNGKIGWEEVVSLLIYLVYSVPEETNDFITFGFFLWVKCSEFILTLFLVCLYTHSYVCVFVTRSL